MFHQLLTAVHGAAFQVHCLSSLTASITETLDSAGDMLDPLQNARRAADLARIACNELAAIELALHDAEEQVAALTAEFHEPPLAEAGLDHSPG